MRARSRPAGDERPRRTAPRPATSRPSYEVVDLEPRRLLAVFNGTEGPDAISVSRGPNARGFVVFINGDRHDTSESSAVVNALGGNDTVLLPNLGGVAGAELTIDLGAGDDRVANTGALRSMAYGPEIIGGDGDDTLTLDNSDAPAAAAFVFREAESIFAEAGPWEVLVSTPNTTSRAFQYTASLENITLDGGQGDETVVMESKPAALRLTANGRGGNDSFFAGSFRPFNPFPPIPIPERAVNFSNPDNGWLIGTTTLTGGDNGGDQITFHDRRASGFDLDYVMEHFSLSRGLAGFSYSAFNEQTLFAAPADEVHLNAVSGFVSTTTIVGDGNTVNVGNGNLFNLAGAITVTGGEGPNDVVNVDDSASPAGRTYDVFRDRLVTSIGITINYPTELEGGVEALELHAGSAGDSVTVHETDADRPVRVDTGAGNDEVYLGSGRLDALLGPVAADGGPGTDGIRFDDARGTAFADAVLTSSTFALAGGPVHTYARMERVTMLVGEAGSRTEVRSLATPLAATGGPGDDVLLVGGGNSDANLAPGAAVSFDGFSGTDRLELDDRLDVGNPAGADNYVLETEAPALFREHLIRKLGPGASNVSVRGFRIDALVLHASDDANSVLVSDARTAVRVNANGGNDDVAVYDVMTGGSVAVDTGAGADRLDVNADADGDADTGAGNFPAGVTVDGSDDVGVLNVRARGTLRVAAGAVLTASPATGFRLDGVIDLAGGALVLREAAGAAEAVNALVKAGHNAGAWDGVSNTFGSSLGTGAINSSVASANSGLAVGLAPAPALFGRFPATFLGQPVAPGDMLLRQTVIGDANLNGRVDAVDIARTRRNQGRPTARWDQGNFNFDSGTNLLDFLLQRRNLFQRPGTG